MSTPLFDLNGRTALITGSSRGLGFAFAEGCQVDACAFPASDHVNGEIIYVDGGMVSVL